MFTVLNPIGLFGLGLLAIPVIVHLFKPRKVRQMPFSSLRWMRASRHRMSRRIRWHQVLLFLLRAAFLVLVVLVLARPAYSPSGGTQPAERFIIVDASRSMAYHQAGRPAPIELARRVVRQLIEHGSAGDRTAIIIAGAEPEIIGSLAAGAERSLPEVNAIQAGRSSADIAAALDAIHPMIADARRGAAVELLFITDGQQRNWSQPAVAAFLRGTKHAIRARLINVGSDEAANVWIADAQPNRTPDGGVRIVVDVASDHDEPVERTVQISRTGLTATAARTARPPSQAAGQSAAPSSQQTPSSPQAPAPQPPELTRTVIVQPGRAARVEFSLPQGFDEGPAGGAADILVRIEPGDGLPDDDVFWLTFDNPGAARVLVIEPAAASEDLAAGVHLRAALDALSRAGSVGAPGRPLHVIRRTPEDAGPTDVSAANVILLADVPRLPESTVLAIEESVKAGGGLGVFLGPSVDLEFYNQRLTGLLAARLNDVVEADATRTGPARLTGLTSDCPLFGGSAGPLAGAAWIGMFEWHGLDAAAAHQGRDRIVAAIENGPPAIIEHSVGNGIVLVFNTTANDGWSNLPRWENFVPLVDRILTRLAGKLRFATFEAGREIELPLPDADPGKLVSVRTSGGRTVSATVETTLGRPMLRVPAIGEPGIYRIDYFASGRQRTETFAVQISRSDSVLTQIDADALRAWWHPAGFDVVRPHPVSGALKLPAGWFNLAPWLMVLACAMLMAEMYFVHRLCPAVNPTVVSSVIARHGFLPE